MLEAEVVYACRAEFCEHAEDFIARRTRLAFLDAAATEQALPRVRPKMPFVLQRFLDDTPHDRLHRCWGALQPAWIK
jgi:glycerol-3-phosphate dehydrogenase